MIPTIIYKYPLGGPSPTIPRHSHVLHIGLQGGQPFAWCESLTDQLDNTEPSSVVLVPTGQEFDPTGLTFMGTILFLDGGLVIHFYRTH